MDHQRLLMLGRALVSCSVAFATSWSISEAQVPVQVSTTDRVPPPPLLDDFSSSISGTVSHPFLNRTKLPVRVRAVGVGDRPYSSGEVSVGSTGSFRIPGLPPGEYVLCARMLNRDLIDPCFWGTTGIRGIRLASKQQLAGNLLTLTRGRTLDIVLRDPSRFLTEKPIQAASGQVAHFLLIGPPGSRPVIVASTRPEPDGQGYSVTVPDTGAVRLVVAARNLQIANSIGQDVSSRVVETMLDSVPGGTKLIRVEFRVTGKAPTVVP